MDNIQRAGGYPDPIAMKPGFTTGYELVGEIIALGDAVYQERGDLSVGDRMASLCRFGAHATHIVLSHKELIKLEASDDPLKMVTLPLNYMTAWGMLKHSGVHLPPGSTILLGSASGGLGTALAQLNTGFDLGTRIIGASSSSKVDYLRSLGVEPIDRHAAEIVEQVLTLTNGEGVDVAYDGVCTADSVKNSLAATKPAVGKVVVFGVMGEIAADGSGMNVRTDRILAERLQPPLITFYAFNVEFAKNDGIHDFYAILDKVRSGKLDPVVAGLLPLRDSGKAHEMLIEGSAMKGMFLHVVDPELAALHDVR